MADDAVIRNCLAAEGPDPRLAASGLIAGAEAYGANLAEAVASGVSGFPSYRVASGAFFWGQDRIEHLDMHLAGKL